MTGITADGGTPQQFFQTARFKNLEVSWAGANPFVPGFGYGSEDGKLLFTDEQGNYMEEPRRASASGEAINGLARSGLWIAVSTRQEVNFLGVAEHSGRTKWMYLPHGAHSVTALPNGYFAAALGRTGLMFVRSGARASEPITVSSPEKEGLYFYRAFGLRGGRGETIVVCACRTGGIGVTEFPGENGTHKLQIVSYQGLDVVDACPIGTTAYPHAVAAVGKDGTLVLLRDAAEDRKPVTLKYDTVQGSVYRLIHWRGDIYLLTSTALYGLLDLGQRFLEGWLDRGPTTRILCLPMEAVDANLVNDRWFMVVMPDEVRKFDLELVHQTAPEGLRNGEIREFQPRTLQPAWNEYGTEQRTRHVVAAGA